MQQTFIKRLIELMEEKNMTQVELAKLVGTTNVTISRYLSGQRNPQIEIVTRIAKILNVSIDYLLGLSDDKSVNINNFDYSMQHILNKLDFLNLLDSKKRLSYSQILLIEKLIEANKDFIYNLKDSDILQQKNS